MVAICARCSTIDASTTASSRGPRNDFLEQRGIDAARNTKKFAQDAAGRSSLKASKIDVFCKPRAAFSGLRDSGGKFGGIENDHIEGATLIPNFRSAWKTSASRHSKLVVEPVETPVKPFKRAFPAQSQRICG